jgi:uncharacterized protein YukE
LRSFGVEPKPPLGFAPNGHAGSRSWFEAALAEVTKERDELVGKWEHSAKVSHETAMRYEALRAQLAEVERARDDLLTQLAEEVEKRKAARADADDASEAAWANRKLVEMLEAQLATAKREALTAYADECGNPFVRADVLHVRDRDYPAINPVSGSTCSPYCTRPTYCAPGEGCHATPSGEGYHHFKCGADTHGAFCDERCCQRNTEAVLRPATPSGAAKWDISEPRNPATPSPEAQAVPSEVLVRCGGNEFSGYFVKFAPADAKRIVRLAQEAE